MVLSGFHVVFCRIPGILSHSRNLSKKNAQEYGRIRVNTRECVSRIVWHSNAFKPRILWHFDVLNVFFELFFEDLTYSLVFRRIERISTYSVAF